MDNQKILFAALVGSNVVKTVDRIQLVENELQKHVLPFLPPKLKKNLQKADKKFFEPFDRKWAADDPSDEASHFFPFSLSIDQGKTWFLLPYEPLLTVNGKNIIAKRYVAKWNAEGSKKLFGSIKERWAQDDYSITITGALFGSLLTGKIEDCFPLKDFQKLKQILTHSKEVWVQSPLLEMAGVNRIAIDDFTFPFTKGENVQGYEIRASSDSSYNLLIEE